MNATASPRGAPERQWTYTITTARRDHSGTVQARDSHDAIIQALRDDQATMLAHEHHVCHDALAGLPRSQKPAQLQCGSLAIHVEPAA